MSPRWLARGLLAWAAGTTVLCLLVHHAFRLGEAPGKGVVLASVWSGGEIVARAVLASAQDRDVSIDATLAAHAKSTLVYERVVSDGPILMYPEAAMALSFVSGRDGIRAELQGRSAYVTPDELLNRGGYDKGVSFWQFQVSAGLDVQLALAILSDRLAVPVRDILDHATFRRFRVERTIVGASPVSRVVEPATMTREDVRAGALAAAAYLARGVDADGRFRYLVDAATNQTLPGYNWPRHAGATFFLAQVSAVSHDPDLAGAALRAARFLRDRGTLHCGPHACVGDGDTVDVGSTALAVIAFVQIAQAGLDSAYASNVPELTAFLRSQQRADGEFMHEYDRSAEHAVDVQLPFYSGEAALALSRAHRLLGDARDLDAAKRSLVYLAGPAWSFLGSRYYWGEEHWTCQAADDLWDRFPDQGALDFCLRWQAFNRKLQYGPHETPFDADGAYGVGVLITPRLTPAASRTEAALATLETARKSGVARSAWEPIEGQARRALALLLRQQFIPGPRYLFADPAAVEGALPGTEVDWQLRIDYAQHAGDAMLRWLELNPDAP